MAKTAESCGNGDGGGISRIGTSAVGEGIRADTRDIGLHGVSRINQREGDSGTPDQPEDVNCKKQLSPSGSQLTEKPENGGMKPFSDNKCS